MPPLSTLPPNSPDGTGKRIMVQPTLSIDRHSGETFAEWTARLRSSDPHAVTGPTPSPTPDATPSPSPDVPPAATPDATPAASIEPTPPATPEPTLPPVEPPYDAATFHADVMTRLDAALVIGTIAAVVVVLLLAFHVIRHI